MVDPSRLGVIEALRPLAAIVARGRHLQSSASGSNLVRVARFVQGPSTVAKTIKAYADFWSGKPFQSEGHRLESFKAPDAATQDEWMLAAANGLGREWKSGPVPENIGFNRVGFPEGILEDPRTQFIAFQADVVPNDSGNIESLLVADTTTLEVWLYLGF